MEQCAHTVSNEIFTPVGRNLQYLPTHVFISKYDMTGIRKGSLALAEQVMSISTKCIIEKCGRVNKWSLDRVLKAVQIQMGMEGEGHDGRGI